MSSLADIDGGPLDIHPNLYTHLTAALSYDAETEAVVAAHQPNDYLAGTLSTPPPLSNKYNDTALVWNYTQLHQAAVNVAKGLYVLGARPGMQHTAFITNGIQVPLTYWVNAIVRVTECNLDIGALSLPRRAELKSFLTRLKPEILITQNHESAAAIDEALSDLNSIPPTIRLVIDHDDPTKPLPSDWISITQVAAIGKRSTMTDDTILTIAREPDPTRLASIQFTSGTSTGNPKGVPRTVLSILSAQEGWDFPQHIFQRGVKVRSMAITANFRAISPALMHGIHHTGGTVVYPGPAFHPTTLLTAIAKYRITGGITVPAMLHVLAHHPALPSTDLSSIRNISIGGDVVTKDMMVRTRKIFGHAFPHNGHGMTEGGGIFRWPEQEPDVSKIKFWMDIAPVGYVAPGSRVKIRDAETGETKRRGEPGELCICGESVLRNYLDGQQPEAFLVEEGVQWFRTGDLAVINEDGLVFIVGRMKDIIKRAGIPISPAALENCVEQYVGTHASALGISHSELGQVPYIVVQDFKGKTPDEIAEHVLTMFGKDYQIAGVVGLAQLGMTAFPLNESGKVQKPAVLVKLVEHLAQP